MPIATRAHDAIYRKLVFSRRAEKLTQALNAVLPASASILDVGCGNGMISWKLRQLQPGRDFTGVEILERESCMIPFRLYDGKTMPFAADSFDYVVFVDVLHHTAEAKELLREAKRIARRAIVIKDHYCESRLDYYTLALMDWVGNAQYGVALPHEYKAAAEWQAIYAELGLRQASTVEDIGLYPQPFNAVFGRRLHFVSVLEVS